MTRWILRNARAVTPEGIRDPARIVVEDGRIVAIDNVTRVGQSDRDQVVDCGGGWVVPGFVDLHVHGGGGGDFMVPDPASHRRAARFHARHGTTGLVATTVTASPGDTLAAITALRASAEAPDPGGARLLGIHLEGPYLNPARRGAQNPRWMRDPDPVELNTWLRAAGPYLKLLTLAPERGRAAECIRRATQAGVVVAAGHSDAIYEQVTSAVKAGLSHVIHTFNGMRGLHHREPGVAGAALDLEALTCELIADGLHVHPAALRLVYRVKGPGSTVLVTDAIAAAGLPDGSYDLGGLRIRVAGGRAELADGSSLAGSTLTMDRAVRNAVRCMCVSIVEAVTMASTTPARLIGWGHRKGRLAPGYDADLVLLDASLRVRATMVEGRFVHGPGGGGEEDAS